MDALEAYFLSDEPAEVRAAVVALERRSSGRILRPERLSQRTGRPERQGLHCAKTFGPTEDLRCLCGKYQGPEHSDTICEKCGVLCGASALREQRWGHLLSPVPLLHPVMHAQACEHFGCTRTQLRRLLRCEAAVTAEGVQPLDPEDWSVDNRGGRHLATLLPEGLLHQRVPVTPAGWRRADGNAPEDAAYLRLINRMNRLERLIELDAPEIILVNEERMVQQAYTRVCKVLRAELRARHDGALTQPPTDHTRALYAEVYAKPADLDARAVLADHLMERRDPRGEFIALQLAAPEGRSRIGARESELQRRHYGEWLGRLAPLLQDGVLFRRGFPRRVRTVKAWPGPEILDYPEWSTVQHLGSDWVPLITHPNMKSLRRLSITASTFERLLDGGQAMPRIEGLQLRLTRCPPRGAERMAASTLFEGLRGVLVIYKRARAPDWGWLIGSPWVSRLDSLVVAGHFEHLGAELLRPWAEHFASGAPPQHFELNFGRGQLVFGLSRSPKPALALHMGRGALERASLWEEFAPLLGDTLKPVSHLPLSLTSVGDWWGEDLLALQARLRAWHPEIELPAVHT